MRRLSLLLCFVFFSAAASAADDRLKPVADALIPLRTTRGVNQDRNAGPELTPVKHLMRAWVETYLSAEPQRFDADVLAKHLNDAIAAAGLTCDSGKPNPARCVDRGPPDQEDGRGYLGGVDLSFLEYGRYLLLKADVGVRCGYDQSAYVYEWRDKAWHLLLQSEQDRYGDKEYNPQNFLSIAASPGNVGLDELASPPLVLTVGFSPWCQSNWQAVYTRLWRASRTNPSPPPLIDTNDTIFMGDDPATAIGSVTGNDAVIEYRGNSIDAGTRAHVLHYLAGDGDKAVRIAPVALTPRDFIDEWLTRPWEESKHWIEPGRAVSTAGQWYRTLHKGKDYLLGGFDGDATRCRADPSLWQIGFAADDDKYRPGEMVHFLIRWMAPYRFTLVAVQARKFPRCDEAVAMPDNLGTLFPLQDWRR